MSTWVSLAPVKIVDDFGTMARQDGDPVPHEHQFYRACLLGLFSLDLTTSGTFFNGGRVGYRNLDEVRVKMATEKRLAEVKVHGQPAFRLPQGDRTQRVSCLVRALGELQGGAKLTLHYTDVTPALVFAAVTRGGNHPFYRVIGINGQRTPQIVVDALKEVLRVYRDQILSDVFIGWARGFEDDQRAGVESLSMEDRSQRNFRWGHPREIMTELSSELTKEHARGWYD
jgi:CRISPR-associated protein Cst2